MTRLSMLTLNKEPQSLFLSGIIAGPKKTDAVKALIIFLDRIGYLALNCWLR